MRFGCVRLNAGELGKDVEVGITIAEAERMLERQGCYVIGGNGCPVVAQYRFVARSLAADRKSSAQFPPTR